MATRRSSVAGPGGQLGQALSEGAIRAAEMMQQNRELTLEALRTQSQLQARDVLNERRRTQREADRLQALLPLVEPGAKVKDVPMLHEPLRRLTGRDPTQDEALANTVANPIDSPSELAQGMISDMDAQIQELESQDNLGEAEQQLLDRLQSQKRRFREASTLAAMDIDATSFQELGTAELKARSKERGIQAFFNQTEETPLAAVNIGRQALGLNPEVQITDPVTGQQMRATEGTMEWTNKFRQHAFSKQQFSRKQMDEEVEAFKNDFNAQMGEDVQITNDHARRILGAVRSGDQEEIDALLSGSEEQGSTPVIKSATEFALNGAAGVIGQGRMLMANAPGGEQLGALISLGQQMSEAYGKENALPVMESITEGLNDFYEEQGINFRLPEVTDDTNNWFWGLGQPAGRLQWSGQTGTEAGRRLRQTLQGGQAGQVAEGQEGGAAQDQAPDIDLTPRQVEIRDQARRVVQGDISKGQAISELKANRQERQLLEQTIERMEDLMQQRQNE